jgi:hypothetical protein
MKQTNFERRYLPRRRVFRGGTMSSRRLNFWGSCTIRDVSGEGACLSTPDATRVPLEFELTMSDGGIKQCRVIWREGERLGITFQ